MRPLTLILPIRAVPGKRAAVATTVSASRRARLRDPMRGRCRRAGSRKAQPLFGLPSKERTTDGLPCCSGHGCHRPFPWPDADPLRSPPRSTSTSPCGWKWSHRVCTSVGGLGTFVALIFVVRQFNLLRTQSELVQKNTMASMDGQLYAGSTRSTDSLWSMIRSMRCSTSPMSETTRPITGYRLTPFVRLGVHVFRGNLQAPCPVQAAGHGRLGTSGSRTWPTFSANRTGGG